MRRRVAGLALLALGGCGAQDARAPILRVEARVDVVEFAAGGGRMRPWPRARAEWAFRKAARASKRLARLSIEPPGWSLEGQGLLEIDPSTGESRGTATIALREPARDWGVRAARSAQGRYSKERPRATLEAAIGRATEAVAGLESLRRAPPERLRAALSTEDPERLVVAARALGELHREQDVPAIAGLLEHPAGAVREAATGALVTLGSRRAVRPLIEADDENDPLATIRTLDAVAALGGDEALAYVELLASGHALETVRRSAHAARRRLLRGDRRAAR